MSRHLVFVYGTLKRGQPNEYLINGLEDAKYIGKAITCQKFPLVIGGPWKLPYLLKLDGQGKNVKGDVVEIGDKGFKCLDEFEDHPDWYERILTDVKMTDDQQECHGEKVLKCWVYFCKRYDETDVHSTHYEDYDSNGDHGQEYDISENENHPSNRSSNNDRDVSVNS